MSTVDDDAADAREVDPAHYSEAAKFAWSEPGDLVGNLCAYCRHAGTIDHRPYCVAFPGQIPDAIQTNRADHRKPYEGDQGVQFEPAPDVPLAALEPVYRVLDALP